MFQCKHCDEQFETKQKLGGHAIKHIEGSRYSVSRKTKLEHECKMCEQPTFNTYCSNSCQMAWQREYIKRPLFESGAGGLNPDLVRLFLEEIHGPGCSCCKLTIWNNLPIPLDIDHVDGNRKNNLPENLRLLCPNCHRQTETWGNSKSQRLLKSIMPS